MTFETRNSWAINCVVILSLWSTVHAGNYPNGNGPKPCSQLKASVQYVAPICVPSETKEGWTKDSLDNCLRLKDTCPELNQAECVWYEFTPSKGASYHRPTQFPTCLLKYNAAKWTGRKYNWIEIYYTNQYGTSNKPNTVFDIVELHRVVNNKDAFLKLEQPNWPQNVINPEGERGLDWIELDTSRVQVSTALPICKPNNIESNNLCTGLGAALLKGQYPTGFDPRKVPQLVNHAGATVTYNTVGYCSSALIGGVKSDVCKVTYTQVQTYKDDDDVVTINKTFAEAQLYNGKPGWGPRPNILSARYAYLASW